MSFQWLYHPLEDLDAWLSGGLDGAGLLVVVGVALLLGLRHATDPDHLVAVTALVSGQDGDTRDAVRLGAWWGTGHAATLLALGLPLIALDASVPSWLETAAETTVGIVIMLLALRVLIRWWQRRGRPAESVATGAHGPAAGIAMPRTAAQSLTIGVVHGLGGTGAIALLLLTALPSAGQAAVALAVFAPMSVVSMALCTGVYAALVRRRGVAAVYETVGMPALSLFALAFGGWYAGLV